MGPSEFSIRCTAATWVLVLMTLLTLAACGGDDPAPASGGMGGASGTGASGGAMNASGGSELTPAQLSDAEIVQVVDNLNTGEVNQAAVAILRSESADVKAFAQMLSDHHSESTTELKALAAKQALTPKSSSVAAKIRAKSSVLVDQLNGSPDQGFDALFIQSEISAHEEALTLVEALHAGADDATLKELIADLRMLLSAHAVEAESLQE